jgi:hypothetical protein
VILKRSAETVEIRINVQNTTREIVLESNQTPEDVAKLINKAVGSNEILTLVDEKGRQIIVPGDKIAFVEIGAQSAGRVGFATA